MNNILKIRERSLDLIRNILLERSFNNSQIEKVLPTLDPRYAREPNLLADTIDCWNQIMSTAKLAPNEDSEKPLNCIPNVAAPPGNCPISRFGTNMTNILADVEPALLRMTPKTLVQRNEQIKGLGIIKNTSEHWLVLYNAPRGFYLQGWADLAKKIMYVDHNLTDLLYTRKDLKEMSVHPLVRSAKIVEQDFDFIRTRYLFASRVGFKELTQFYEIGNANTRINIGDIVLSDDERYLKLFAPHCSMEEYKSFAKLIATQDVDQDDAEIYEQMAELEALRYNAWPKKLRKSQLKEARNQQLNSVID